MKTFAILLLTIALIGGASAKLSGEQGRKLWWSWSRSNPTPKPTHRPTFQPEKMAGAKAIAAYGTYFARNEEHFRHGFKRLPFKVRDGVTFSDEVSYGTLGSIKVIYFHGSDDIFEWIDNGLEILPFFTSTIRNAADNIDKYIPSEYKTDQTICVGHSRGAWIASAFADKDETRCGAVLFVGGAGQVANNRDDAFVVNIKGSGDPVTRLFQGHVDADIEKSFDTGYIVNFFNWADAHSIETYMEKSWEWSRDVQRWWLLHHVMHR